MLPSETNPYAPPAESGQDLGSVELPVTLPLRYLPRDGLDMLLGLAFGPIIMALYLVLPGIVVYWFSSNANLAAISAICIFFAIFVTFALPGFRAISIGHDEVVFRRYLAPALRVKCHDVTLRQVSRSETLRRLFWPGIPSRISIFTGSCSHNYEFSWPQGCCYFAPHDVRRFLAAAAEVGWKH